MIGRFERTFQISTNRMEEFDPPFPAIHPPSTGYGSLASTPLDTIAAQSSWLQRRAPPRTNAASRCDIVPWVAETATFVVVSASSIEWFEIDARPLARVQRRPISSNCCHVVFCAGSQRHAKCEPSSTSSGASHAVFVRLDRATTTTQFCMTMHTTTSDHLPLHQVKDGPSGMFTKRRRPHQHLPPRVASLRCRVEATSLCDRPCLAWLPPRLIFHVRVRDIESNATWLTHCSLRDIHGLYRHLVDRAVDPATIQALQVLRCPGVPLLQRRDGLVIKAMCADTEHFLHNLLAVCRATSPAPDGAFVAFFVAAFLRKKPPGHDTLRPL